MHRKNPAVDAEMEPVPVRRMESEVMVYFSYVEAEHVVVLIYLQPEGFKGRHRNWSCFEEL